MNSTLIAPTPSTSALPQTASGTRFDAILDLAGSRPLSDCVRLLTPKGSSLPSEEPCPNGRGATSKASKNRIQFDYRRPTTPSEGGISNS
jgi:hypothetical protein